MCPVGPRRRTLWSEQPVYFRLAFALDRVKALEPRHPEWKTKEPFASLLRGDLKSALAGGEKSIGEIVMAPHVGRTTDRFEQVVREWVATARHPKTGRPYTASSTRRALSRRSSACRRSISSTTARSSPSASTRTSAGPGARLCLYVHHTDAEREWAYDRQSSVGKLDKGLDEAKARGWTVVSMKDDGRVLFPAARKEPLP